MNPIVKNGNKLRWKFENMFSMKKGAFSDNIPIGPVDWKIYINDQNYTKRGQKYLGIFVWCQPRRRCDKNSRTWICEADMKIRLIRREGEKIGIEGNIKQIYTSDCLFWGYSDFILWNELMSRKNGYLKDDSIEVEVDLDFKFYDFSKKIPNFTDITINVENTEFHLNKKILTSKSKYFHDFYRDINPIYLKLDEVKAKNFCYMLASLNIDFHTINKFNYIELVKIAKKFDIPSLGFKIKQFLLNDTNVKLIDKIMYIDENDIEELMVKRRARGKQDFDFKKMLLEMKESANYDDLIKKAELSGVKSLHYKIEQYLIDDKKLELIDKIKYADENNYQELMKKCIKSLDNRASIKELEAHPKFSELGYSTKIRIWYR